MKQNRFSALWQNNFPFWGNGLYDTLNVLIVGLGTGFLVILFKKLIHFISEGAFGSIKEIFAAHTYAIVLVPILGGAIVGLLQHFLIEPERHHGVAAIMESLALADGRLNYKKAPIKVLTSALSIGFGASVGPEDPSVQIGANLGAWAAKKFRVTNGNGKMLVAMGAASGIAAAFNAPIAGVFFSLEILLGQISASSVGLILFGAVLSSIVTQAMVGTSPAFPIPTYTINSPVEFVLYLGLGLLAGLIAFIYIKGIYLAHDVMHHSRIPRWLRPILIGALLGLVGIKFPQIFGDSYETIGQILNGQDLILWLLIVLLFLKILMTTLSLGAGFIGGVFAPSLFLGAALGGAYGVAMRMLFPALYIQPSAFALVGMAAVLAGTVHAPMTAIMLLFEMTNDYRIILPLMFAVAVSLFTSRRLHRTSVYETSLVRSGLNIHRGRDIDILESLTVAEAMQPIPATIHEDTLMRDIHALLDKAHSHGLPVVDDEGLLVGVISISDLESALEDSPKNMARPVKDFCTQKVIVAYPEQSIHDVLKTMGYYNIGRMPVVEHNNPRKLLGWISRTALIQAYNKALTRYKLTRHRANQIKLGMISGVSVFEFEVGQKSPLAGHKLKEIELPSYSLIASIERNGQIIIPHGNAVLHVGDKVAVISHDNDSQTLTALFEGQ